jgi:hypothetical protein
MLIRAGFEVAFEFTKAGAILLNAYVHPSRATTISFSPAASPPSIGAGSMAKPA